MRKRTFETEQWLPYPCEAVFAFFSDIRNLDRITPPWLHFRTVTPDPIDMKQGTVIEHRFRLRGIPIRWHSEIIEWEPPRFFSDHQIKGPYKIWEHKHTFEEKDGGTLIRDEVTYAIPGGPLEPLIHALFVGPDVRKIFAYRQEKMKAFFRSC